MRNSKEVKQQAKDMAKYLKAIGVHWEVEHVRPMIYFEALTSEGPDKILSRGDFGRAVEEMRYKAPAGVPTAYGNFVCTTGGFTRLTLQMPDGEVIVSKYNFPKNGNYFKSLGFVKAAFKSGIFAV